MRLFLGLLVWCACVLGQDIGQWENLPLQPSARSKHGQEKLDQETIFIWGGRASSGAGMNDAWLYNITTNTFATVKIDGDIPIPRYGGTATLAYNSRHSKYPGGYIFAGNDGNNVILYDMYEFDTETWLSTPLSKPPIRGRWRHATVVLGRYVLVCFGIARGVQDDIWAFDTETLTWKEIVPVNAKPIPRFDPCCTPYNSTAMLCFGGTRINVTDTNEVLLYDINWKEWVILTPTTASAPTPRRVCGCFYHPLNGSLIVTHGYSASDLKNWNDFWHFDMKSRAWYQIPTTSLVESTIVMDSIRWTLMPDGKAYMFGGWGTINNLYSYEANTGRLRQLYGNDNKPPARTQHCVVSVGELLIALFGLQDATLPIDMWIYDTVTSKWAQKTPSDYALTLGGLLNPTCTPYGTSIFIFGGRKSAVDSVYSNKLTLIQSVYDDKVEPPVRVPDYSMTLLKVADGPSPRWRHASVLYMGNLLMYGGRDGKGVLNDMWVFDTKAFMWRSVPRTSTFPGKKLQHAIVVMGGGFVIVGGGDGDTNTGDRWFCSLTMDVSPQAQCSQMASTYGSEMTKTDIVRAYPVAIAPYANNTLLVFGGQLDSASTNSRSSLVLWSFQTGVNRMLAPMPTSVTEGGGAMIGKSVYLFGGKLADKGVVLEQVTAFQKFKVTSDIGCSAGFVGISCIPCARGSFYDEVSRTCVPCPFGRKTYASGLVGRVSCVTTSRNSSSPKQNTIISQQPQPYVAGSTPQGLWIAIIVIAVIALCVLFGLIYFARASVTHRRDRFLNADMQKVLEEVYNDIDDHDGLDEKELFIALQRLATPFTRHHVTEAWISVLILKYDSDGSRRLEFDEFMDMVLECLLTPDVEFNVDWKHLGYHGEVPMSMCPLPPKGPPGSAEEHARNHILDLKREASDRITFSLNNIDLFTDRHTSGALGDVMMIKATSSGGIASLTFCLSIIVLVMMLAGTHIYENVYEERSSLPYVLVSPSLSVRGDVVVTVTLRETGFTETDKDACSNIKNVTSGISSFYPFEISCIVSGDSIVATWKCRECIFQFDNTSLRLVFDDSRAYAGSVAAKIVSKSGVEDQMSVSEMNLAVVDSNRVLRGMDTPTRFSVDAFPLLFGWKDDVDQGKNSTKTGYLFSFTGQALGDDSVLTGLDYTHGLLIDIILNVIGSSTLMVTRRYRSTDVEFLSSLLGTISGVSGGCVALMKAYEGWKAGRSEEDRQRELRKERERELDCGEEHIKQLLYYLDPQLTMKESQNFVSVPEWWGVIIRMMRSGLSYRSSRAIVEGMSSFQSSSVVPEVEPELVECSFDDIRTTSKMTSSFRYEPDPEDIHVLVAKRNQIDAEMRVMERFLTPEINPQDIPPLPQSRPQPKHNPMSSFPSTERKAYQR
eukprot:PhF_6_TR10079/c0_g1_i1/m.15668